MVRTTPFHGVDFGSTPCRATKIKFMKKALVIYIGCGYSERETSYDNTYVYQIDMRENYSNHLENVFKPLEKMGYSHDFMLLTNKHEKFEEFQKFYNAIDVYYDDFTSKDFQILHDFYFNKYDIPPGHCTSGGRFLKIKDEIPEYDLYLMIRADLRFKMSIDNLKIDLDKINWLWPETDYRFYTHQKEEYLERFGSDRWFWDNTKRVNGNFFNVVPKKFFNAFRHYIYMEHVSLFYMLKELSPLITMDDVNLMLGDENCYVSDQRFCENPVVALNKKIIQVIADVNVERYGIKN